MVKVVKVRHRPGALGEEISPGLSKTLTGVLRCPCVGERGDRWESQGHICSSESSQKKDLRQRYAGGMVGTKRSYSIWGKYFRIANRRKV